MHNLALLATKGTSLSSSSSALVALTIDMFVHTWFRPRIIIIGKQSLYTYTTNSAVS